MTSGKRADTHISGEACHFLFCLVVILFTTQLDIWISEDSCISVVSRIQHLFLQKNVVIRLCLAIGDIACCSNANVDDKQCMEYSRWQSSTYVSLLCSSGTGPGALARRPVHLELGLVLRHGDQLTGFSLSAVLCSLWLVSGHLMVNTAAPDQAGCLRSLQLRWSAL